MLRGYSRYGAWYGNPYGAWDVMFLSYCLHFAGVPQTVVPQRAGVMALHSDLRGSQWLTDADGSTARPGDIVIYNTLTTASGYPPYARPPLVYLYLVTFGSGSQDLGIGSAGTMIVTLVIVAFSLLQNRLIAIGSH